MLLLFALPLLAQEVRYELRVADRDDRLAEVRATFPTTGKDTLDLTTRSDGSIVRRILCFPK